MIVTVHIDTGSAEGRKVVEYLSGFPEIVTFENITVNEADEPHQSETAHAPKPADCYIPVEEFRHEVKKTWQRLFS